MGWTCFGASSCCRGCAVLAVLERVRCHFSLLVKRVETKQRKTYSSWFFRLSYLWLTNPENMLEPSRERFNALRTRERKTARAWALKEARRGLWNYRTTVWATPVWRRWYFW